MKKIISIAMAAVMCLALTACGNTDDPGNKSGDTGSAADVSGAESGVSGAESEKTIEEKGFELLETVEFAGAMVPQDMETVEVTLGITPDMVSEHIYYLCGMTRSPDEFGIFAASSEDAATEIWEMLHNRIDRQRERFIDYNPDEAYKLTDFVCEIVDGNTVIYAVCGDNRTAREILG